MNGFVRLFFFYPSSNFIPARSTWFHVERMSNECRTRVCDRDEDDHGSKRNLCYEFVSTWISEIKIYFLLPGIKSREL